jgi:benzodiazapine receptor
VAGNKPEKTPLLMGLFRYHHLKKPSIAPPERFQGLVFAGAWLALDVLDGFGFWQGWRQAAQAPSYGAWVGFWLTALMKTLLKASWTPVFFGVRMIRLALLLLALMLALSIANTGLAYSIDATAGGLLTPSLCWLLYALVLNLYIVLVNDVHTDDVEPHPVGMELLDNKLAVSSAI